MSKRVFCSAFVLGVLALVPIAGSAQDETPRQYVYATYLYCDTSDQWLADLVVENVTAPIYDEAVENGTITAWGWMAHHTGGKWRRLLYRVAPTLKAAVETTATLAEAVAAESPQAAAKFSELCPQHEDYIWQQVTGSGAAGQERGDVGFSVYLMCDMTREERADEIVEKIFAPVYNQAVADGKITTWGWMSHVVGGKWRRIATMTGSDDVSLLQARGEIITEIGEKFDAESTEFSEICSSHQDYLWNVQHEKP